MSFVVSASTLEEVDDDKSWWMSTYGPGEDVPVSGIYRCTGCKREITSNKGDPFPPQNRHQHPTNHGDVEWKLNVRTNTDGVTI